MNLKLFLLILLYKSKECKIIMIKHKSFGVIGGDMRQLFMSESIYNDGNDIKVYGIKSNRPQFEGLCSDNINEVIKDSEYIILPLPATCDNIIINAPFCESQIKLSDSLVKKLSNKTIFCGISQSLKLLGENWRRLNLKDYSLREEFQILNAVPTAEGALHIAMDEFNGTIHSSRCLVTGYGRIGKVLAKLLKNMGADVTVSSRKASDVAWIQTTGYNYINSCSLPNKLDYDLIFNTVPFKLFDRDNLLKCSYNSIIIDLASKPGGVDFELANFLEIKAIHALGIPGKFSPITAGEIIKKTIYNMLEEEKL